MNQETQPFTTTQQLSTATQQLTNPQPLPLDPSTTLIPEEHKATPSEEFAVPFAIYQRNLVEASPRTLDWLWQDRLPLAAITLLDGDHGCGKSLLALQIAAHVSNATPMPDCTSPMPDCISPIKGGVVIVTPSVDATSSQLQFLSALGADLSRVEILSYIHDPENSSHTSGYRPFSLPLDFPRLFEAVERVNACLIIFDQFINLLSHENRWTDQRLDHLLADLNQHLLERNIACLLIRNCTARGGLARPSVLERSEHFLAHATSRLLLAPDPINPSHLLLTHAKSAHTAFTPTLILQIHGHPYDPKIASITFQGSHSLQASDFLAHRPEGLHRRLLSQHLLKLIADATDPIPVATLYARCPHSSPFQIQRALSDLLNMGQIERPARGFYAPAIPNPVLPEKVTINNKCRAEELVHTILDEIEDDELRARPVKKLSKKLPNMMTRPLATPKSSDVSCAGIFCLLRRHNPFLPQNQ